MSYILWSLMWVLVAIPALTCSVFSHRRIGARRNLLKQTLMSMALEDAYMRGRHGEVPASERKQRFASCFELDFRAGIAFKDYLLPVTLFTVLSLVGWFLTLSRFYPSFTGLHGANNLLPLPFAFGFAGAFLASVLTLFNGYSKFNLDPEVCYSVTYRILFSSTAAYLAADMFKDTVSALVAFGVGLFPVQATWDFITNKTAKALGVGAAEGEPGAELTKIQGLEDRESRQKLLDIDINSVQALATYDPLQLFCKTTLPLRAVLDMIDKAILYLYIGDTIKDLRQCGINGVIELRALVPLAERKSAYDASGGTDQTFPVFFNGLNHGQLITDLCAVIKQTPDELKAFLYNLYYDPQVCLIYDIWGVYMDPKSQVTISSMSPGRPAASGNNQTVTVNGSRFQNGLTVTVGFPGGGETTLDSTQVRSLSASSFQMIIALNSSGTWTIRVYNPDGGQSNTFSFNVSEATATPSTSAAQVASATPGML